MVNELRLLRTHVILDSSTFDEEKDESVKTPSQSRRQVRTVMGDARAEHLLLAAKKVRTIRQEDKTVGRLTLDELQKRGVVGPDGGLSYSEGYGGLPEEDQLLPSDDEDKKPSMASPAYARPPSSSVKASGTPLLPRPKKNKRNVPTTPSRARTTQQAPQTTPGGSNFNDLLLAAEMATRPGTPSRSVGMSMSSARSTTNWEAREASSAVQSPSKKPRRQAPATVEWSTRRHVNKEGDGSPNRADASALDLLAQASQDVATGTPLASAARLEGAVEGDRSRYQSHSSRSETPLGPAINLEGRASATPSHFPPGPDNPFVNSPNAFQSPTGAAVPGLGKYVHLSSTVPARRVRSPYLKWTKEEVGVPWE